MSTFVAVLLLLVVLFVPATLVVAQEPTTTRKGSYPRVRIFSPKEGQIWFTGETRQIFWRLASLPPPPTPPTLNITLRRQSDPAFRLPITTFYPTKNLFFKWAIPASVPTGDDYIVRINPIRPLPGKPNIMASKSKPFTIVSRTQPQTSLSVAAPKSGAVWYGGQRRFIQWKLKGATAADATVSIYIQDTTKRTVGYPNPFEVASGLPAQSTAGYRWQVPFEFRSSDGYQFTIVASYPDGQSEPVAAVQAGTFSIVQVGAAGAGTPTVVIPGQAPPTPVA